MVMTKHAAQRWQERFPNLNLEQEWHYSVHSGRKSRKRIAHLCRQHKDYLIGVFKGFYYRISRHQVVFVVVPGEKVVTVFEYQP